MVPVTPGLPTDVADPSFPERGSGRREEGEKMERAVVVYESMFGNTRAIAEAITEGLASCMPADLREVGGAPAAVEDEVGLLVVGGPTHTFGLSRPATREDATRQAAGHVVSEGPGLREWLGALPRGDGRVSVATFDTRIDHPRVPGSAARKAEKHLRQLRYPVAVRAESFYVSGTPGPLVEGELERARSWGEALGSMATERSPAGEPEVSARTRGSR
jgi:hypothetical protein